MASICFHVRFTTAGAPTGGVQPSGTKPTGAVLMSSAPMMTTGR